MANNRIMACLLVALAHTSDAWAAAAGRVLLAVGETNAVDQAGAQRPLQRGNDVFSGDALLTQEGRLQVRFTDGGLIALQPQSRFRVDDYQYQETDAGNDRNAFSLVKGGLRVITGAVGVRSRDSYQLTTPVATIGIRGTAFSLRLCQADCPGQADGLYAHTGEGIIFVANAAGSVDVPAGKSVYVPAADALPQLTDMPPLFIDSHGGTSPSEPEMPYRAGEQHSDGTDPQPSWLGDYQPPPPPPEPEPNPILPPPEEPPAEEPYEPPSWLVPSPPSDEEPVPINNTPPPAFSP